jgi:predicted transglutaminase-like cysteine proteinase
LRLFRPLPVLLGLAFAVAPAMAQHFSGAPAAPPLFGTREVHSTDISAFTKWTGVLAGFAAEQHRMAGACAPGEREGCAPGEWQQLLDELRGLDIHAKLERVNAAINRHPYIPSLRNWGESNRWETPFEFFRRGGQCQDYAIAKYLLLRAAGVAAGQLRLVVLRDMRLGLDHAVTAAYVDGTVLLLDNQMRRVTPASSVHHYQPYYSINEQGWWLHVGPNARYAAVGTVLGQVAAARESQ